MLTSIHAVMSELKCQCVARMKYTYFLSAVLVVSLASNGWQEIFTYYGKTN